MTVRRMDHSDARVTTIRALEGLLSLLFFLQLVFGYLLPLQSGTLQLTWWSWMAAASPAVLIAALEVGRKRCLGVRLPPDAREQVRAAQTRLYGRAY